MRDLLENIWLWIVVLFQYAYDVCRYGLQGAEDKTLDDAISLSEGIQRKLNCLARKERV